MADNVGKSETVLREEKVLAFWKGDKTFEKSLAKHAPKGEFIFYDGPPFATGLPHTGSLLSSIIKDVVPRYKTMRGYTVPRVWGWDCHGLPIESLVEKKLGLKTKKDILDIGIATFNETARSMVMEYVHDWEKYIDRVGRWVDFKNSYKTMDNSYIESVWWGLKELDKKKLLYEGRKVLMYCTHCETPLAKAEIAMDNTYKDITEEAVTIKFKVKNPHKYNLPENTYILAWTTTPWTLPGNVGLAVGPDITYSVVQKGTEHYIEAEDGGDLIGKNLVGIEYEPLFDVPALKGKNSYKVWAADFVATGEGTGIVHTAVMYGEDDFALGQKEKLPMVQLLEANGHYNNQAPELIRGEFYKKAEKVIKEDLESRGLMYSREKHTHSYPHCYRCGSPLIYNAVASWFINIQKVKVKMLSENEKITWVPEHLKHGRFHNIVENAPDWTISRNRFWASPLPIWKEKGGSNMMVVGSLNELLTKTKRSGNRYYTMRHGEAQSNVEERDDYGEDQNNHLTDNGKRMVVQAAHDLKKAHIDLVIVSPIIRTQETAAIVARELGLPDAAVMVDERLREGGSGQAQEVRQRIGDFIFEVERRYTGKNILVISHGYPLWMLHNVAARKTSDLYKKSDLRKVAVVEELSFVSFPHNANFELDLHRPYIDDVKLVESGKVYERIPEVIDCWVESGSMPFASMGYPTDTSRVNPRRMFGLAPKGYPGDFIAEYIAQTRTWFYYMHAMGVLLFNRLSFKAVVSTGTILAADGSKMSKSKGNYTDPWELMEKWGADALRLHLMGSVVMQSEDLNFRDEDIREAHNRTIGILWNSYKFFELYKGEYDGTSASASTHVLDRWMRARLNSAVAEVTSAFDAYDMPRGVRALRSLVDEYSTWYLRRSRDRVKSQTSNEEQQGDNADKQHALANQREALLIIAKLLAPITPYLAESIYQGVVGEGSVHLTDWPTAGSTDEKLVASMTSVRELASAGLQLREKAGIKVRQPLASMMVMTELSPELAQILKDELNVKEIKVGSEIALDINLTSELKEEGMVRDLARKIQDWRKAQNLTIADRPTMELEVNDDERAIANKYREQLMRETGLKDLVLK